ncbi:MAG: GGDEF domain-containing protein [Lachnospiraceae bacterium]|nr:GGDEF domain-containing protein [Lachnospiraceae bacterium]
MRRKRFKIGVFTGNAHTYFPRKVISGIYQRSLFHNVDLLFFLGMEAGQFSDNSFGERRNYDYQFCTLYDYATLVTLDAIIVSYGAITTFQDIDSASFFEKFTGIPCVIVSDEVDTPMSASVEVDNYGGMKTAINHLIEHHGFKRILYVSGPTERNRDSKLRMAAYRDAMEEHALPVEEAMIAYGDYTEYVDDLIETLLDHNPDAEAIASANDEMCRSIYRVCRKRGLEVGEDIAVTGFDDIESAASDDPPLTTLRQNGFAMGEAAYDMAMDFLRGTYPENRLIPVDFIARESCGCAHKHSSKARQKEDMVLQYDRLRVSWHRSLTGPSLIQDLINLAETPKDFFYHLGKVLYAHGSTHSYVLLLPKARIVRTMDGWKRPRSLHVALIQDEDKISVSQNASLHRIGQYTDILDSVSGPNNLGGRYFHFLLFDGQRNYGIMGVEIKPDQISDFYMIATQLGISLHFLELTTKQAEYLEKLAEQNTILNFTASSDELTGLLNRRGIFEHTLKYLNSKTNAKMLAMLIDLDHLKEINDSFGHAAGDFALRTIASVLKDIFRDEKAAIGRYGGDEFLAIIDVGNDDPEELRIRITKQIKERFRAFNETCDKPYYVEASVGGAAWSCDENIDFSGLISRVDLKLYESKQFRRTSVRK